MKVYKRRRQQYLFAVVLGVLAAVNLLFFLILYQPARSEYMRLQNSIKTARANIQSRKQRIARLEKLSAQLETSAEDRKQLFTMHFIPKDTGWSEILPELNGMIEKASVKNTRKEYAADEGPQYGLYSVKIKLPVTGPYANVMKFIRQIENAEIFFIINSIDVHGSTEAASDVSMGLNLETFFYR